MNRVFIDTSAILALMVPTDRAHARAGRCFERLKAARSSMTTTSYVLAETYALVGRRLGLRAVKALREGFMPLVDVVWVDGDLHDRGLDLLLARQARDLSIVDAVSFSLLRASPVDAVFAFDSHFEAERFPMLADS